MNPVAPIPVTVDPPAAEHWASSEVRLLPDGRILAHHLTPELAVILARVAGHPAAPSTRSGSEPSHDGTPLPTDPAQAPHHDVLH